MSADDPYLWLEEVTGERALSWVRERNAETVAELTGGSRFEALRAEIREVFDSADRIPYISRGGGYRYDFWRDREHPRGLWRRTTLSEYRQERPDWEILLDVDALARDEDENWVYHGAQCLRPDYRRALVSLSRGGADAAVMREFDIERREFVTDGFQLPEAKSTVDWIDADRIYVATDFGPGTLTTSGYPRTVRQWRRGTPLAEAELVYEGKPDDISVSASHDDTEGFERDFVGRALDFYSSELYLRCGDRLRRVEVPEDAMVSVYRRWLLVELRSEWTVGQTYPAGCLLVADFDEFMAGSRGLRVLFTPDERTSLAGYSWTRHHLILDVMRDVVSYLSVLTPAQDWRATPLTGTPPLCTASAWGTDPDTDDEYLLDVDGFLTPSTLAIGTIGAGPAVALKRAPSFFRRRRSRRATALRGLRRRHPDPVLRGGARLGRVARRLAHPAVRLRRLRDLPATRLRRCPGQGLVGARWLLRRRQHPRRRRVRPTLAFRHAQAPPPRLRGLRRRGPGSGHPRPHHAAPPRFPGRQQRWAARGCDAHPVPGTVRRHRRLGPAARHAALPHPAGRRYPPTLLTTSTRDDRVHPGHARKLVARMREYGLPVTYYENIEGGHGGAADNEQAAFMSALAYEFLWRHLSG